MNKNKEIIEKNKKQQIVVVDMQKYGFLLLHRLYVKYHIIIYNTKHIILYSFETIL